MSVCRVVRTAIPALLALAVIVPEAAEAARDRSQPTAPANLRITATTSSSVTLAWDAAKSGSGIAYYTVLEKSTWTHFNVPASQTSFTRTRLWPNINHSWIIYAVDTKGNGSAESNTVTYRTPPDTTPPSTPALSAPFVGPTRAQLDWSDSVDDVSGVTYTVNVSGRPAQTASLSQAVVPGLAPSSSYTISVTARDNWGNAATSNTLSIRRLRQRQVRRLGVRLPVDDRVCDPERDEHVHDRRRRQLGQRIAAEHGRDPEHVALLS
jgi:hypothetical protein